MAGSSRLVVLCCFVVWQSACPGNVLEPREGIDVQLSVTSRFPRNLVTGALLVIRSLPGGGPIALRTGTDREGLIGDFPFTARVVDREGDGPLEYEVLVQGLLFAGDTKFLTSILSAQLTTAPFAIEARLNGPSGTLATTLTTTDYRGRPLRFIGAPGKLGLRVELTFDCGAGVPCQGDENHPPALSVIPGLIDIVAGRTLSFSMTASDVDGDPVTIGADTSDFPVMNLPEYAAPLFTWTPAAASVRELPYTARFSATDGRVAMPTRTEVKIRALLTGNSTPVIRSLKDASTGSTLSGELTVAEGGIVRIQVDAVDPDGDPLTHVEPLLTGIPAAQTSFDAAVGLFRWTPPFGGASNGTYAATFRVRDSRGGEGTRLLVFNVVAGNRPPVFEPIGPQLAVVGREVAFTVRATDPDGDPVVLSFDFVDLPPESGAAFESSTGRFSWTPRAEHVRLVDETGAAIFRAMESNLGKVSVLRVPITVLGMEPPDGGMSGPLVCPFRCLTGEACIEGVCRSTIAKCLTACASGELCIDGQCLDAQAGSCGGCPAGSGCVRGTCLPDRDQDGVPDPFDNCPDVPSPSLNDQDGDGMGNACDARPGTTDLRVVAGTATAAASSRPAASAGFKVRGTLGVWVLPTVLSGANTRLRSGESALGGQTNRALISDGGMP